MSRRRAIEIPRSSMLIFNKSIEKQAGLSAKEKSEMYYQLPEWLIERREKQSKYKPYVRRPFEEKAKLEVERKDLPYAKHVVGIYNTLTGQQASVNDLYDIYRFIYTHRLDTDEDGKGLLDYQLAPYPLVTTPVGTIKRLSTMEEALNKMLQKEGYSKPEIIDFRKVKSIPDYDGILSVAGTNRRDKLYISNTYHALVRYIKAYGTEQFASNLGFKSIEDLTDAIGNVSPNKFLTWLKTWNKQTPNMTRQQTAVFDALSEVFRYIDEYTDITLIDLKDAIIELLA